MKATYDTSNSIGERGCIAMEKCHMCSKTTFQIESPTKDCDRRLKKCFAFMKKRANSKHVSDDERVNDRGYELLTKIPSCLHLQRSHKKLTTDYLFEVRVAEGGDGNGETERTSEFWKPKNWDPEKDNADFWLRMKMPWMISEPFETLMGHVSCPLEGLEKCNDECRMQENSKNFKLVKNAQMMVISMNCKCTRNNPRSQRWHVRLYKRKSKRSIREDEEKEFLKRHDEMRENPEQNKTSPNEEKLPTIEEETEEVIDEETEEVIESNEGEPRNDNSFVDNNIPPHNTGANDSTIQENTVRLNYGNPQPLGDQNISATAFVAGRDIGSEEVDDGISPWKSTQPQRRKNINNRIWYS
ncbi:7cc413cf-f195-4621-8bf6-b8d837d78ed4 [Sclerotinia trifoliorum]|uniref:7cc413cf-f195-4621-8bf6-b8d837d78ed4 n=1 Tax=Sclerotinia trifoliorum TaxID=28548 RepID=A0A8H2W4Q6_9HELO|nr:7cc413cf-f195-4621-8bf6-b8d837d78ed4 [Sclerotinia trifoliorum]